MSEGQVAALLLWLVLLAFSLNASLLRTLGAHPLYQHLCLGGAIVLVPLWTLRAGLHEGLEIHFLGLTSLTLLLGWRLALLAPCLTLLLLAYFGVIPIADIGWQALIGVALPVATSWLLFLGSWAWLPRHLFVYLFVAAFLGGALSISAKVIASALLMGVSGTYSWHTISADYLSIWPLLLFPEALLNGMTMTLLAVYRPHWVNTFFDREYLGR
ncbi:MULTISPECIES: energy-coupling factor ABC transporter permease [Aeromonas]|uniref:Energy-coupling factor ABC transporter permease n=1 Tax=Aeromonas caviae TaxID=648 RepID=A0A3G9I3U4_AERCA|nr:MULTISPECIES: energy-coupling factor ABC transporter permease [Aeromonas]MBL0495915.1 energy-coupling factor ABC transporter permease [Aeromonas caviae]MBL0537462.1 energy-coupling factor ABC transporter permease [Aeromonas caviae]MBL0558286.1 energy-coupling factor ABC transporter permease [Aeromonas caviae]MDH1844707.1 energy-coupling factor ABC transporter permease [Aeromonas caviae]MDH1995958.1 energy-coupling factor ABC transporter permease [Aeromonas caviae]